MSASAITSELGEFNSRLREEGLRPALRYLNSLTFHRYTGIFQFEGDKLRCVALIDKWDASVATRDDVPLMEAYCAHLHRTGEAVRVDDGPNDPRFPWMANSPFTSYCGALVCDPSGEHWGALCHFDTARWQARPDDLPLVVGAAALAYGVASRS